MSDMRADTANYFNSSITQFDILMPIDSLLVYSVSINNSVQRNVSLAMQVACSLLYLAPNWHSSATLTEVFPCFFLSCAADARV